MFSATHDGIIYLLYDIFGAVRENNTCYNKKNIMGTYNIKTSHVAYMLDLTRATSVARHAGRQVNALSLTEGTYLCADGQHRDRLILYDAAAQTMHSGILLKSKDLDAMYENC